MNHVALLESVLESVRETIREWHFDGPEEWAPHSEWRDGKIFKVTRLPEVHRPGFLPDNSRITGFEGNWYGRGNKISGVKF